MLFVEERMLKLRMSLLCHSDRWERCNITGKSSGPYEPPMQICVQIHEFYIMSQVLYILHI